MAELWNFSGVKLGTMKILQVLLAVLYQQFLWKLNLRQGVEVR